MTHQTTKSLTKTLLWLLLVLVFVPSSVIAWTPPQNEGVTNWILGARAGGAQDNFNAILDAPLVRESVQVAAPNAPSDKASAVFTPGDPDLTMGPLVSATLFSNNGNSVGASSQANYVVGVDVVDFTYTTAINPSIPTVFIAYRLAGSIVLSDFLRTDGSGIIAGTASFTARARAFIPGLANLILQTESLSLNTFEPFIPVPDEEERISKERDTGFIVSFFPVRLGERINVEILATVGYFGNTFNNQAPNAFARAIADPLFWIDPNAFYEFENGDIRPATDFFQLSVSPGINFIGPEGGLPLGGVMPWIPLLLLDDK